MTEGEARSALVTSIAVVFDHFNLSAALTLDVSLQSFVLDLPGAVAPPLQVSSKCVKLCADKGLLDSLQAVLAKQNGGYLQPGIVAAFAALKTVSPIDFDPDRSAPFDLEPLYCLIDRTSQHDFFVDEVGEPGADTWKTARLLFCVAESEDASGRLWQRFRDHTVKDRFLPPDKAMHVAENIVDWPTRKVSAEKLRKNAMIAVCRPGSLSEDRLSRALEKTLIPIILQCEIGACTWTPGASDAALAEFCRYWSQLKTNGQLVVMIFSGVMSSDDLDKPQGTLATLTRLLTRAPSPDGRSEHLKKTFKNLAVEFGIGKDLLPAFDLIDESTVLRWIASRPVTQTIPESTGFIRPVRERLFSDGAVAKHRLQHILETLALALQDHRKTLQN
jgi:hypothetical protein